MALQARNGNVDIVVEDDAAAVATARKYLGYFQGPIEPGEAPDQRRMRPWDGKTSCGPPILMMQAS